ncbi:MAG TPA: metallophosphoesterase [Vicinamibacterales bacterium]|nr:metallophosphoesterase [Vicinamibacterales bacterium]
MKHKDDESEPDRRGFLKCMAWVGTGAVWTMTGGVLKGMPIEQAARGHMAGMRQPMAGGDLRFVQISDSHIGFNKEANPDVTATLRAAIAKIKAMPQAPSFLLHTGDLTHLSKPEEFDTLQQELSGVGAPVFYVPGEHDVLNDNGKSYLARYGKNTQGAGWYSFDQAGVHFIGLVNVVDLKAGGLGTLGTEQLEWLEKDVKRLKSSTPIVIFAHIPLWSVYPEWGWGTDDSARALAYVKRFGSVSVLNGHIHQVMQKVEGHVTFHTAMSTAFPQPAPGSAPSPGPMKVEADRLRKMLGLASIMYHDINHPIAITDAPLENETKAASAGGLQVAVDNFSFAPAITAVPVGTMVTWTNRDDVPHNIVSTEKKFASPVLDTDQAFSHTFDVAGTYKYYCSLHPKMTGQLLVG